LSPIKMISKIDISFLKELFPNMSDYQIKELEYDYEKENRLLQEAIEKFQLVEFTLEIGRVIGHL
jgi:hypothetical protein